MSTPKSTPKKLSWSGSWSSSSRQSYSELRGPPLAWTGIRHRLSEQPSSFETSALADTSHVKGCSQAVFVTCLHLAHEMGLRDVGMYAWTQPTSKNPTASTINIMKGYTRMARACSDKQINFRTAPDPSVSVIQHHLQRARQAAGADSYVAAFYCGHGIQEPPTEAGELWCYDVAFDDCVSKGTGPSEYIPILFFDYLTWAGASTCYIWDSQYAGRFIRAARTEATEIDSQLHAVGLKSPTIAKLHPPIYSARQIHFAACGADEILPRVPGLPTDIFTSCLVSPLRMCLLFHNIQIFPLTSSDGGSYTPKTEAYMLILIERISKTLIDRLWSELFAILHTIAWQILDGGVYQKLFGQSHDLIATMSGGFLVAQRILTTFNTHPESIPAIPSVPGHALWTTWDLILDNFFEQLPQYAEDADQEWENGLKLVSFMSDQLESILTSDQSRLSTQSWENAHLSAGLSRLPIICQAAMSEEFRLRACDALDACLLGLEVVDLSQAIQGGVLDIAGRLLAIGDHQIANHMVSIWSSLIRHDACTASLVEREDGANLCQVGGIRFFLGKLEDHLETLSTSATASAKSTSLVIQTAAVLSSVACHADSVEDAQFAMCALRCASTMLRRDQPLIQQWGSLLIAQVLGAVHQLRPNDDLLSTLRKQLLSLVLSCAVESRATAVYALTRWIPRRPITSLSDMSSILDLARILLNEVQCDASPLVRKELASLFKHVLECGGHWTTFAFWLHALSSALLALPELQPAAMSMMEGIKRDLGVSGPDAELLGHLMSCLNALLELRVDPDMRVSTSVGQAIKIHVAALSGHVPEPFWADIASAASSSSLVPTIGWTEAHVEALYSAGHSIADRIRRARDEQPHSATFVSVIDSDLLATTKQALQQYIAREASPDETPVDPFKKPLEQPTENKTWLLRQRILEDSLVLAERQGMKVGLPWKWHMKDMFSPDPWSHVCCHSFLNTVLSVNNSHDLLLWDWSTSRKTGSTTIKMQPNARIHSTRFVNELHEQTVMLAETNTGDVHVVSGPPDEPTQIRVISSFRALDVSRHPLGGVRNMVTTWWRQSGKLCVGGASDVVNVWDCPVERRVCSLRMGTTGSEYVSVLYTEPKDGNVIIAGLTNGLVKIFDLRHRSRSALLEYRADTAPAGMFGPDGVESGMNAGVATSSSPAKKGLRQGISASVVDAAGESEVLCAAVMLGETRYITSAVANGLVNTHDLRDLSSPVQSVLAHPNGISSSTFQPHSGLITTLSNLHSPVLPASSSSSDPTNASNASNPTSSIRSTHLTSTLHPALTSTSTSLSTLLPRPPALPLSTFPSLTPLASRDPDPRATWTLYRCLSGTHSRVSTDTFHFGSQASDVWDQGLRPYTYTHPLRPFLAVGFGRTCYLRGSGVGKGADTDSGSYVFLRQQAQYLGKDLDGDRGGA